MFSAAPASLLFETQDVFSETKNQVWFLAAHLWFPFYLRAFVFSRVRMFIFVICMLVRSSLPRLLVNSCSRLLSSFLSSFAHKVDPKSHIPTLAVPSALNSTRVAWHAWHQSQSTHTVVCPGDVHVQVSKEALHQPTSTTHRDVPCMMQSLANAPADLLAERRKDGKAKRQKKAK